MDEKQHEAVQQYLNRNQEIITHVEISGSHGTGKTLTLVEILNIRIFELMQLRRENGSTFYVVVTSFSSQDDDDLLIKGTQ